MRAPFALRRGAGPVVAVALHAGHDLRLDAAAQMALPEEKRRREEDPFTDEWLAAGDHAVVAFRSRFEVDLNRSREEAVYRQPEQSWGLAVWRDGGPTEDLMAGALEVHGAFYAAVEELLREVERQHRRFLVLDLHSYNHRRGGPDAPAADDAENPEINVGTGSMDRERWAPLVDAFLDALRVQPWEGRQLDVRENVRFLGGWFPRWVHETFPESGCALAIEVKKTFMDEWSGVPDPERVRRLGQALSAAVEPAREALREAAS